MGQKVNPVGLRLGVNRGWDSVWYAKKKDFGKFLIEDFKIREYIKKNVINSGVSKVMIERTSKKCFVTIYTSRPGFVIGKKGSDIDKIKNNLSKFTTNEVNLTRKFMPKSKSLNIRSESTSVLLYSLKINPKTPRRTIVIIPKLLTAFGAGSNVGSPLPWGSFLEKWNRAATPKKSPATNR